VHFDTGIGFDSPAQIGAAPRGKPVSTRCIPQKAENVAHRYSQYSEEIQSCPGRRPAMSESGAAIFDDRATTSKSPETMVSSISRILARAWGPQQWWPAETPFEVIAGAILTQNTSWKNVERALANLRDAGVLSVAGIRDAPPAKLEELVRPSGYYR